MQRFPGQLHRAGRLGQDVGDDRFRLGHQAIILDHKLHEAELQRLIGRDIAAAQQHFGRPAPPHQTRQARRSAKACHRTDGHLRVPKATRFHGNADHAGLSDFEAAAEGVAIQRGHHHLAQILDLVGDRHRELRKLAHLHRRRLTQVLDVRTRRKGLVAGTGDDHRADRVIPPDLVEQRRKARQDFQTQRIQRVRAVEGQVSDLITLFVQYDGIVAHRLIPPSTK